MEERGRGLLQEMPEGLEKVLREIVATQVQLPQRWSVEALGKEREVAGKEVAEGQLQAFQGSLQVAAEEGEE